jgi:hypothetical protein
MSEPAITRTTYVEDLVRDYPRLVVPLVERGIVCMRCGMVSWDTLEEAAGRAGVEDIDALVGELQELARDAAGTGQ